MAIEVKTEIATENYRDFYTPYKRHRMVWFRDVNRYENFRYNQHFTDQEVQDLLTFRQAPIPIGLTAAICDMAEALFTASDPVPRVIPVPFPQDDPRNQYAKSVAYRYNAAIKATWRESFGGLQFDKIIRDYNNVGVGYHYLVPRFEFGQFSVDYRHIPWHYVFVDPNSKDILNRDAEAQLISFVLSQKQGYKLAKQIVPDLTFEEFKSDWCKKEYIDSPTDFYHTRYSSQAYDLNTSVRFMTRIVLEENKVYQIIPKSVNAQITQKIVREITPELERMRSNGLISIVPQTDSFVTEYTSIGAYGWKKVYPIRTSNLIPCYYDHRDNPYPHGRVWYIYPLQRALNKFVMLAILNATLSNSLKFFAEANSIVDINKIENYASIPGVFLQWRRVHPNSEPPVPVNPVPLSDAFLQFPKFVIYLMEYVSGIWSVMQGDSRETPNVFSTVATLQNAGGMKIKRRLRNLEVSLSQSGKVNAEFYREYAPPNGTIVSVGKEEVQTIEYNKLQATQTGEIAIQPETDLSIGFKDVEFVVESSKGYQAATEANLLATMASQLKIPELVPLVLDRLNIPDVDKVVDSINQRAQLAAQVQQQQEAIQKLESDNQQLTNQIVQKTIDLVRAETKGKAGRVLERFRKDLEQAGINFQQFEQEVNQQFGGVNV